MLHNLCFIFHKPCMQTQIWTLPFKGLWLHCPLPMWSRLNIILNSYYLCCTVKLANYLWDLCLLPCLSAILAVALCSMCHSGWNHLVASAAHHLCVIQPESNKVRCNMNLYLHLQQYGPFILFKYNFFTHISMARGRPIQVASRKSTFGSICPVQKLLNGWRFYKWELKIVCSNYVRPTVSYNLLGMMMMVMVMTIMTYSERWTDKLSILLNLG
jgi:hypothetical protein